MKYVSVVPCFEPDNKLLDVIKELKKNKFDIVIVNDGSHKVFDVFFDKCKEGCKYIKYDKNHGKGYALKKAFKYIKENYKECIIVTVDCDGQHKIKDAVKLCNVVEDNKNTIVLGKRVRNKKTPLKSKIGNHLIKNIFASKTGVEIYDTQTGLRAFDYSMIDLLLKVKGERYEYETNMLIDCISKGIKIKEVKIDTIYENNNKGSHFRPIKDSFIILKNIVK